MVLTFLGGGHSCNILNLFNLPTEVEPIFHEIYYR
jgi:hypothetical protein